jgi:hypothetical protein
MILDFYDTRTIPRIPKANLENLELPASHLLAAAALLVVAAGTRRRDVGTPPLASPVMLDSKPFFDSVIVEGATVMVAVIAVPLELITMMVWLALSVCMAISVALVPVPREVESPGVSVKTTDPKVI